jgi:hypothetical protein
VGTAAPAVRRSGFIGPLSSSFVSRYSLAREPQSGAKMAIIALQTRLSPLRQRSKTPCHPERSMWIRLLNPHAQSKDPCTLFRISVAAGSSTVLRARHGNETEKLHEFTSAAPPPSIASQANGAACAAPNQSQKPRAKAPAPHELRSFRPSRQILFLLRRQPVDLNPHRFQL